jgi:hypothetical protein
MSQPVAFELEILRECAGEKPSRPWGAAVGAAREYLRGAGYIDSDGVTDKGRALLRPPESEKSGG